MESVGRRRCSVLRCASGLAVPAVQRTANPDTEHADVLTMHRLVQPHCVLIWSCRIEQVRECLRAHLCTELCAHSMSVWRPPLASCVNLFGLQNYPWLRHRARADADGPIAPPKPESSAVSTRRLKRTAHIRRVFRRYLAASDMLHLIVAVRASQYTSLSIADHSNIVYKSHEFAY